MQKIIIAGGLFVLIACHQKTRYVYCNMHGASGQEMVQLAKLYDSARILRK